MSEYTYLLQSSESQLVLYVDLLYTLGLGLKESLGLGLKESRISFLSSFPSFVLFI